MFCLVVPPLLSFLSRSTSPFVFFCLVGDVSSCRELSFTAKKYSSSQGEGGSSPRGEKIDLLLSSWPVLLSRPRRDGGGGEQDYLTFAWKLRHRPLPVLRHS